MLLSKSVRKSTVVTLLAFGLAACSESPTAPGGISPDVAGPLMAKGGSGNSGSGSERKAVNSRTFVIVPGAAVVEQLGDHVLRVPADVICDPATSLYGRSHWDEPCDVIQRPIEVTARWTTYKGRPVIRFSPDVRFVPSSDESRWVMLTMKDGKGIHAGHYYAILWYDAEAASWVDESAEDPSVRAHAIHAGNQVARRLKHFSDYTIWSGFGSYNVTSGLDGEIFGLGGW
jgi:hypothetical protein